MRLALLAAQTTDGKMLAAFSPKDVLRSDHRVPDFLGKHAPRSPLIDAFTIEV